MQVNAASAPRLGHTWNGSSVMPPKTSSNTHPSASPQRAAQLVTVTLGEIEAVGMERDVRGGVGAHACARVLSGDKPRETSQVSLCLTLSSPGLSLRMVFVPPPSPLVHNLSLMTHTLSGFDLGPSAFSYSQDHSSPVTHCRRSVDWSRTHICIQERGGGGVLTPASEFLLVSSV